MSVFLADFSTFKVPQRNKLGFSNLHENSKDELSNPLFVMAPYSGRIFDLKVRKNPRKILFSRIAKSTQN